MMSRWILFAAVIAMGSLVGCASSGGGGGGGGGVAGAGGDGGDGENSGRSAGSVVATTPQDGATGVAADTSITITFDRPVGTDCLCEWLDPDVGYASTWSADNTVVTFTPDAPLTAGTTYTMTIESMTFADGSSLDEPFSLRFTVGGGETAAD
jgi:hypothetical protein